MTISRNCNNQGQGNCCYNKGSHYPHPHGHYHPHPHGCCHPHGHYYPHGHCHGHDHDHYDYCEKKCYKKPCCKYLDPRPCCRNKDCCDLEFCGCCCPFIIKTATLTFGGDSKLGQPGQNRTLYTLPELCEGQEYVLVNASYNMDANRDNMFKSDPPFTEAVRLDPNNNNVIKADLPESCQNTDSSATFYIWVYNKTTCQMTIVIVKLICVASA